MPPYSIQADLEAAAGGLVKLTQLADQGGDGVIDALVVTAAIAEADAEIGAWTRKRWSADSIPLTVRALSARMAVRFLRRNRSMTSAADIEQERIDRDLLKAIASGAATAVDDGAEASAMLIDKAEERDTVKSVGRWKLRGFW